MKISHTKKPCTHDMNIESNFLKAWQKPMGKNNTVKNWASKILPLCFWGWRRSGGHFSQGKMWAHMYKQSVFLLLTLASCIRKSGLNSQLYNLLAELPYKSHLSLHFLISKWGYQCCWSTELLWQPNEKTRGDAFSIVSHSRNVRCYNFRTPSCRAHPPSPVHECLE